MSKRKTHKPARPRPKPKPKPIKKGAATPSKLPPLSAPRKPAKVPRKQDNTSTKRGELSSFPNPVKREFQEPARLIIVDDLGPAAPPEIVIVKDLREAARVIAEGPQKQRPPIIITERAAPPEVPPDIVVARDLDEAVRIATHKPRAVRPIIAPETFAREEEAPPSPTPEKPAGERLETPEEQRLREIEERQEEEAELSGFGGEPPEPPSEPPSEPAEESEEEFQYRIAAEIAWIAENQGYEEAVAFAKQNGLDEDSSDPDGTMYYDLIADLTDMEPNEIYSTFRGSPPKSGVAA